MACNCKNKNQTENSVVKDKFLSDYIVCVDSGHGKDVVGKKSPDGRLMEWGWTREIKYRVIEKLMDEKIADCFDVNPEENEPGLTVRAKRANEVWTSNNKKAIFVSIHVNAAGKGGWGTANYWSIWTSPGKTEADTLADCIWEQAYNIFKEKELKVNKGGYSYGKSYENSFTVLTKTKMPAVLVENFFQDNETAVDYLLSDEGKDDVVNVITYGIKDYLAGVAE